MQIENQMMIYQSDDWKIQIDINLENETIWLNLNQISQIFWRDKSVISRHIKNIFKTWELSQKQTVAFFATVALDWKTYNKSNKLIC